MSPTIKTFLFLPLLSTSLTLQGCGVLFPEERPPTVLTKTEVIDKPILLEVECPPPPPAPKKPEGHNTLSKDAAGYFAALDSWAMACRDINQALNAILRPSQEPDESAP